MSRIRAHAGEVTDITIHEDERYTLIASSSRDRTIQLLQWSLNSLELLQTLDEHAGAVTSVLFAKNGEQLLSCSADRSVVVREAARQGSGPPLFIITRTVTLKSSPTCLRMSLFDDTLLVSATDRTIQLVSTRTGRVISCFKAGDSDGGDSVIMSSLVHLPSTAGSPIVAGVAGSDKSVRMYSEDGTLLARDWGHTEGVTDIALLKSHASPDDLAAMKLVTVAADGTIFVWATTPERPRSRDSDAAPSFASIAPGIISAEQPLRKVISHSEIARFHRARSNETEASDPTAATASTGLKKKPSRLSIRPPPPLTQRLEPSPLGSLRNGLTVRSRQRSPSPTPPSPSPRLPPSPRTHPRSVQGRHRLSVGAVPPMAASAEKNAKVDTSTTGFGSIQTSTDQLSRMLKAYRQKIDGSCTGLTNDKLQELERELDATLQIVRRKLAAGGRKEDKGDQGVGSTAEDSGTSRTASSSQDASFVSAQTEVDGETMGGAENTAP